ncbi:MAG: DMT family transporter, partial [Candidatus Thermoplasmatota archaeon]|nr:DMT family transporter [Candidatus Thermoplasmatota archaeon]
MPLDRTPFLYVAISAILFGVSAPLAKILLDDISPVAMAGLLYLGAFLGLLVYSLVRLAFGSPGSERRTVPLERADVPYLAGAVITGGVLGPILLMWGLSMTSGFATSLMLNMEAVATGAIAVVVFREHSGARLWLALGLMTTGGILLAWDPELGKFTLAGPLLVTLAMFCWGVDNNLTRAISSKDAVQITMIKGAVAGSVSLGIALALGAAPSVKPALAWALLLGAFSIGISL